MDKCICCDGKLVPRLRQYFLFCQQCGFWQLESSIAQANTETKELDNDVRSIALSDIRKHSFERILLNLKKIYNLAGKRLLDVGCAYGWFLEMAERQSMKAIGIEPEAEVAQQAIDRQLDVRVGFFPDALKETERFDFISFNDVLEHLPNIPAAINASQRALAEQGNLVLAIPSSRGIFFKIAMMLEKFGIHGPLDRMWQLGYPSPHLAYFNDDNLNRLLSKHGFELASNWSMPVIRLRGLWSRVTMDNPSVLKSVVLYVGILSALPILRFFSHDHNVYVYRSTQAA